MKKMAIIGASYLQVPLINKAKEMGMETHVFAWAVNDEGEKTADFFYPISITEKEQIAEECKRIGIHGICSIASDLAVVTVNYVANQLHLTGNPLCCTEKATNKYNMRKAFMEYGVACPHFYEADEKGVREKLNLPVIVKPTDRSGSRGITRIDTWEGLEYAVKIAKEQSMQNQAIVEEYVEGMEYSVECISFHGKHRLLAITKKYTTGAPHYIETGHIEPSGLSKEMIQKVQSIVFRGLGALEIENGASHSEIMITEDGEIYVIEIGARMGGDCIGSHLVPYSTGIDYVQAVLEIALGHEPCLQQKKAPVNAAIRYIFNQEDNITYKELKLKNPEIFTCEKYISSFDEKVTDSSNRVGYYIIKSENMDLLKDIFDQTFR